MIGIGKDHHERLKLSEILGRTEHLEEDTFDRCFGPDGHEDWCLHLYTIEINYSRSRITTCCFYTKLQFLSAMTHIVSRK